MLTLVMFECFDNTKRQNRGKDGSNVRFISAYPSSSFASVMMRCSSSWLNSTWNGIFEKVWLSDNVWEDARNRRQCFRNDQLWLRFWIKSNCFYLLLLCVFFNVIYHFICKALNSTSNLTPGLRFPAWLQQADINPMSNIWFTWKNVKEKTHTLVYYLYLNFMNYEVTLISLNSTTGWR